MADTLNFDTKSKATDQVNWNSHGEIIVNSNTDEDSKKALTKFICNGSGDGSGLLNKQLHNINLSNISVVSLRGIGLKQLELDFSKLTHIFDLDLSYNELTSLPSEIIKLKQLLILNLSHNKFELPPVCISIGFHHISHLDLSSNQLIHFDTQPLSLPYLTYLNLRDNHLKSLPFWLSEEFPCRIEYLDLSLNPCFKSPLNEEFMKVSSSKVVSNVRTLKVASTCLGSSSLTVLKSFTCLSCLDISSIPGKEENNFNLFSDINTLVLSVLPLEELEAANCGLSGIPEDIDHLVHLRVLNISGNPGLLWLSDSFCRLLSLVVLDASNCSLILLPKEIGLLSSLQQLWLSQNKLSSLPSSIYSLTSLEMLDLYDNNFEEAPNIEDFHNLKGFDIGANFCDPPLLKEEYGYICLRDNLRCSLKCLKKRCDIKKSLVLYDPADDDSYLSSSSNSSQLWDAYSRDGSDDRCSGCEDAIEEDWDLNENEDIDDNFDPNNCMSRWDSSDSVELLQRSYNLQENSYLINYVTYKFCENIAALNSLSDVEGQFDD